MYYNKVEICGVNTSKLKTLTDEEKRELLRRSQAGDLQARNELICGNLRLVLSIIQRFTGRKENLDDLFQVGCIGLIKSVDHFNLDLDVKFSTYAVPMNIAGRKRTTKKALRKECFSFTFFSAILSAFLLKTFLYLCEKIAQNPLYSSKKSFF